MYIGEVMKKKRISKGISSRNMARSCYLSQTTISLAEKGADVRLSTLFSMCKVLGIRTINIKDFD